MKFAMIAVISLASVVPAAAGGAAFVDGAELLEAVADGEDLDLVEFAGDLLAVAGNERNCRAFVQQGNGSGNLVGAGREFGGQALFYRRQHQLESG